LIFANAAAGVLAPRCSSASRILQALALPWLPVRFMQMLPYLLT